MIPRSVRAHHGFEMWPLDFQSLLAIIRIDDINGLDVSQPERGRVAAGGLDKLLRLLEIAFYPFCFSRSSAGENIGVLGDTPQHAFYHVGFVGRKRIWDSGPAGDPYFRITRRHRIDRHLFKFVEPDRKSVV